MDDFKRSAYKMPSYADIIGQSLNLDSSICPKYARAIIDFVEAQLDRYFAAFRDELGAAKLIWMDESKSALDRLKEVHDIFERAEDAAHRAFITVYMQYQLHCYESVVIRDMVYSYIDEYAGGDMDSRQEPIAHGIALDLPLVKWTDALKKHDKYIKRDVLHILKEHLYEIWLECGIQEREIKRLIKYGH